MRQATASGCSVLSLLTVFLLVLLPASVVFGGSATINCQAHKGPCSLPLGNETVTLEITPRPVTAMQESAFTVAISGKQVAG